MGFGPRHGDEWDRANLLNPLQVVRHGEEAIAYLKGEDQYANRAEYPGHTAVAYPGGMRLAKTRNRSLLPPSAAATKITRLTEAPARRMDHGPSNQKNRAPEPRGRVTEY